MTKRTYTEAEQIINGRSLANDVLAQRRRRAVRDITSLALVDWAALRLDLSNHDGIAAGVLFDSRVRAASAQHSIDGDNDAFMAALYVARDALGSHEKQYGMLRQTLRQMVDAYGIVTTSEFLRVLRYEDAVEMIAA